MSTLDIKAVRENWSAVNRDLIGLGCAIFAELFKINNSYVDLFTGIRESGEVTVGNAKLREHAIRVLTSFDSWIIALSDGPVLEGLILREGFEHIPRKIYKSHFQDMHKAIRVVLSNNLGAKFNGDAFDKVMERIVGLLAAGQVTKK